MLNIVSLFKKPKPLNFIEIKELSERMELAEMQAKEAIMVMRACKKQYAKAYRAYMIQCGRAA